MGRLTAIGAALAVGLVLAAPAGGALELRFSITPKRPHALEATTIVLRTFAPLIRADGSCCRLEPWRVRSYPFRVEAVGPDGTISRIRVRRGRGNEWRGVVRFPTSGRWLINLPQFFQRHTVTVRPALPTPRFSLSTATAAPGDLVRVRVERSAKLSQAPTRLYLVPAGANRDVRTRLDPRVHFVGAIEPSGAAGEAFTVPPLEAGTYALAYWCRHCLAPGTKIAVQRTPILKVVAPAGTECPATDPNGDAPPGVPHSTWHYHGNGHLAVLFSSRSPVVETNNLGGYKMLWVARPDVFGGFRVTYRRVDVPSEPVTATTVTGSLSGYDGPSWASRMSFEPGCWRIDASVFDVDLTFVAQVVRREP